MESDRTIRLCALGASVLFALASAAAPAERPDPHASPYAVKGGTLRMNGSQPPKSYNAYVDNNVYTHMTFALCYETLLATDSMTAEFIPSLARDWSVSDDGLTFTFEIDPDAKWSDGRPVLAEDVKWTFDAVLDPASDTGAYRAVLGAYHSPEVLGARTVRFRSRSRTREWRSLLNCATFEILPRHAFAGTRFNALEMQNAVVSGPYRLSRVQEQVEAEFTRRTDWWRANRPSSRGIYNFDRVLLRYHADNENAFEAFLKRRLDLYPVYSAHLMATRTGGEAFDHNWIRVRRVRNRSPMGFQGFAMNLRRPPFDDVRVRRAMAMLLDREKMNRTLMFGEYFLLDSYFADLWDRSRPCPDPKWKHDRAAAARLLDEAGWTRDAKTGLRTKGGRVFSFDFLSRSAGEDKFLALFNAELKAVGIEMNIVRKDFAGWMRDMDAFNFDMTWAAWGGSIFRNPEPMWASAEADRAGGNNITGLKDPEVDRILAAEKGEFGAARRAELYRELDRLLAERVPYVLLWGVDCTRLLYWNKFGMPANPLGRFGDESAALVYWWYDADSAAELESSRRRGAYLPAVPRVAEYAEEGLR